MKVIKNKESNIPKEDFHLYRFRGSPIFWRQKAAQLKHASELLWPHAEKHLEEISDYIRNKKEFDFSFFERGTFAIYLSLIGYSTECLLKGLIIKDNPVFISDGRLPRSITTHNLIVLAKIAKIQLSRHEEIFCEQALKAMIVDARYPVSKEVQDISNCIPVGGHCKKVYEQIFDRIYPQLNHFVLSEKDGAPILHSI